MGRRRLDLELGQFLPYRINLLSKRISDALSVIYTEEFAITVAQWRVLLWLNTYDTLYAKDLVAYTYMDKTQISRLLVQLEDRGLVSRQTDSKDMRSQQLFLTEEGKGLLDKAIPRAIHWEEQLIASLETADYQCLLKAIEKLEKQLDRLEGLSG